MNSIILFTNHHTKRLTYIVDFVFRNVLGIEVEIITNEENFIKAQGFKINYSEKVIPNADLHIVPTHLLTDTNITEQKIEVLEWHQLPVFFKTSDQVIPFDLLSASFYLITRYEEYLPYTPDLYHRYPEKNSIAYRYQFLSVPLVDKWIMELKKMIQDLSPSIQFKEKEFTFIPTYDIDIAYSYVGKGFKRSIGGAFKDLLLGRLSKVKERILVLSKYQKDPFDCFDELDLLHKKFRLSPIYFFLLSGGGKFDKNISPSKQCMKQLIQRVKSQYDIGIHPSFQSNDDLGILKKEIDRLHCVKSRQHYIRFTLPSTYRNLINFGILEDYSMGYGSINGFRSSTSYPYKWFDLERNEGTPFTLFPFCYMECNSFFEQGYTAEQAFSELKNYYEEVKKVGGTLITIWHNFSLGSDPSWKAYKLCYEQFLEERSHDESKN